MPCYPIKVAYALMPYHTQQSPMAQVQEGIRNHKVQKKVDLQAKSLTPDTYTAITAC